MGLKRYYSTLNVDFWGNLKNHYDELSFFEEALMSLSGWGQLFEQDICRVGKRVLCIYESIYVLVLLTSTKKGAIKRLFRLICEKNNSNCEKFIFCRNDFWSGQHGLLCPLPSVCQYKTDGNQSKFQHVGHCLALMLSQIYFRMHRLR